MASLIRLLRPKDLPALHRLQVLAARQMLQQPLPAVE